ncbi:hypothetical protein Tco_0928568, partial [Tanacetum coccineum]
IIMAQQQHAVEESKILTNIIKNHPLRFSIAASSSVPWIYMAQFWHTLKEDGSKYRLKFMLDKKELSLTLDDFRTIFHLPQANDNNHNSFVPPPSFSDMVPFYKQQLGFTMELKTSSSFKTTGLLQPWQTLCKIFSKCLTTRVTGWDQPPLQIMQMILAEHKKSNEEQKLEKCGNGNKHWHVEEIEKMMEGSENVIDDSLPPRNDEPNNLGTRLDPKSDKESPKVEITNDEEKGKIVEESRSTPFPTPIRSPRIRLDLVSSDAEKTPGHLSELQGRYTYLFEHLKTRFSSRKSFDTLADHLQEVMVESLPTIVDTHIKEKVKKRVPEQVEISLQIQKAIDNQILSQVNESVRCYMSEHILHVHPVQSQTPSVPEQQYQLYLSMKNDPHLQQQYIAIWLALQIKFENLQVPQTTCRPFAVHLRDQDDPHDDAHPEGENRAKQQKTYEYMNAYMLKNIMMMNSTKHVPQDIMEKLALDIDEAKLRNWLLRCMRQRCLLQEMSINNSFDSRWKILFESDIVWGKKEPGKPKEEVYSNSKIIQVIKTYWELGHEHKFITEIVARRANDCIMSIASLIKEFNKNDMRHVFVIMNGHGSQNMQKQG